MSTEGMRNWKCPQCGRVVSLPVTQLDPLACNDCLARMNRGSSATSSADQGPLGMWQALPELVKLAAVGLALIVGLLIGFVAGQLSVKRAPELPPRSNTIHQPAESASDRTTNNPDLPSSTQDQTATAPPVDEQPPIHEQPEERPPAPGPGYKWVRGRTRKDGTRGPGHWAKDPYYKGESSSGSGSDKD